MDMNGVVSAITVGAATAMATTFDDNIYLAMFFSRTNHQFRPLHIIVGEYLGFSMLIGISLSGFLLGRIVDSAWLGLLGLLPISIGVNTLLVRQSHQETSSTRATSQPEGDRRPSLAQRCPGESRCRPMTLRRALMDHRTYQVSAVSIANGGNNIAIYIPLFATCSLPRLAVILLVCYAAIGLWCFNSWFLIRQPQTAVLMSRTIARIVPFVLIALGLSILMRNGTPQALLALASP
jgi:cadmium resistance protein CadD (predicted permease)